MLGWHVSIYRLKDGGASPAAADSETAERLAVWQTGWDGLRWIDELVQDGKAISLGGTGYPCRYTATVENLVPRIVEGPPGARAVWTSGASDVLTDKWDGTTVIDRAAIEQCRPGEWLMIVAWDES